MKITEENIRYTISLWRLRNNETNLRRVPMEAEDRLRKQILLGDYKNVHLKSFPPIDTNMAPMAKDPLTHYTYVVVGFITAWSRAVIGAGVTPDVSFDLSDALLFTLSQCKTVDEVHQLCNVAAVMFAKAVFEAKQKQLSYQVVQIQNYITANIYRKITISDIAAYVELSPNYLCSLFSREMQISLHNYIQREKVTVSCNLLRHTKRPISDIATYMGFQTQSNFAAVFRKWMNMTPSEYRQEQYWDVF